MISSVLFFLFLGLSSWITIGSVGEVLLSELSADVVKVEFHTALKEASVEFRCWSFILVIADA